MFTLSQPLHTSTPYAYHEAMNQSAHNRIQQPTAKVHHRNSSARAVVVEGYTVGHVPREILRVRWYFWRGTTQLYAKLKTSGSVLTFQERTRSSMHAAS